MTQDCSVYFRYYLKYREKKQQKYAAYSLKCKGERGYFPEGNWSHVYFERKAFAAARTHQAFAGSSSASFTARTSRRL